MKLKTEQRYDPTLVNSPIGTTTPATDGLTDYKNTDYVGNIIYETSKSSAGTVNKTRILVDGGYIENGVYHYYLVDHLGNNRVVANASGTISQRNHYYPFGTAFAEKYDDGKNQKYKYNGKELDDMHQLNLYDYSARYYESAVGKFTSVDPLAEKKPWLSLYHYCSNNPINKTDPNGRDDIFNEKGFYVKSTNTETRDIKVTIGGKEVSVLELNLDNSKERQIAANIVGHYAMEAGVSFIDQNGVKIGSDPKGNVGVARMPGDENVAAYNKGDNIFIRRINGTLHPVMEDGNNMVNTFVHEDVHKVNDHSTNEEIKTIEKETMAVSGQISHSSYSKTTSQFQRGVLKGYGTILGGTRMSDASMMKRVEAINALLPKDVKWKLNFKPNFGNPIIEPIPIK
ncbi:RHS repeat-associated core domain-containing protein [Dysgonomonas sp. Marseille-P4677]|uniref:RHS repeat-associated core domain-containing protein n=1 Tax=Dysgonomonas sp. Marseille-P4677 TaxID=2364790 RepID=UPI00351C3503